MSDLWTCPDCLSPMPADQEAHHRSEHARQHREYYGRDYATGGSVPTVDRPVLVGDPGPEETSPPWPWPVEAIIAIADVPTNGIVLPADALRPLADGVHTFWDEVQQALVYRDEPRTMPKP